MTRVSGSPAGRWAPTVDVVHRRSVSERDVSKRLRVAADALVGRPYVTGSLVGGPDEREEYVADLGGFDCVTLVESAIALARSRSRRGFVSELRLVRYRDGVIDWRARLHYFFDWLKANHERGAIRIKTRGAGSRCVSATLGTIEGLPGRRVRFHVVPKAQLRRALGRIEDGSVVAFASVRARLDFFHVGLVFRAAGGVRNAGDLALVHAARSAGRVIREPLGAFLGRNRMRGIAFATVIGGPG